MDDREQFYLKILTELIPDKNASILVCGGGILDKTIMETAGFRNVTISNLDSRMAEDAYAPYKWKYENAEALSCADESFDYTVIHAAVHHTSMPHKVLIELYRVAKKGVLAVEARDSAVMRLLERSGVSQVYEHAAVYYNDCRYGGVNNSDIPNYVFRWTEREIEKTIRSYAPCRQPKFAFRYATAFPATLRLEKGGGMKVFLFTIARPFYWLFTKFFPKQQNLFAFYIEKPNLDNGLFPWLIFDSKENKIKFNKAWGDNRYKNPGDNK